MPYFTVGSLRSKGGAGRSVHHSPQDTHKQSSPEKRHRKYDGGGVLQNNTPLAQSSISAREFGRSVGVAWKKERSLRLVAGELW